MSLGFLITGRMKSTRLPLKLTKKIQEREVIAWMIDRAKLRFKNEEIVIATSTNPQDDALEEIAAREGVKVFRGDEEDVIQRLYLAAKENGLDNFINITADCPLFGFDLIDSIEHALEIEKADLVTQLDFPHGIFTYGLKTASIEKVLEMKKTNITEVWGDYFYNNPDLFKVLKIDAPESMYRPDFRLTLDYPEDLAFFKAVFAHFGKDTYKITSSELVQFLDNNPEIVNLNKDCKAMYQKRWEAQKATEIEKDNT